jgi:hypothetical protein
VGLAQLGERRYYHLKRIVLIRLALKANSTLKVEAARNAKVQWYSTDSRAGLTPKVQSTEAAIISFFFLPLFSTDEDEDDAGKAFGNRV